MTFKPILALATVACATVLEAGEPCTISKINLPETYQSERLRQLEGMFDVSAYDFTFSVPQDHVLLLSFITFYKGRQCDEASYLFTISPEAPGKAHSGTIKLHAKGRSYEREGWRQWFILVKKDSHANYSMATGLPFAAYAKHKDSPPATMEASSIERCADVSIANPGKDHRIWHYIHADSKKEYWRFEIIAGIEPFNVKTHSLNKVTCAKTVREESLQGGSSGTRGNDKGE